MSTRRAWLDLTRASNLTTALSNALTGMVLGYMAALMTPVAPIRYLSQGELLLTLITEGWPVFLAVAMLYTGGMILNDVVDADVDARERPERPIPSGRVSGRMARAAAIVLLIGAIFIMWGYGQTPGTWAMILVVLITLYNLLHKLFAGAAVLMGLCRAGLYVLPASIFATTPGAFWRVVAPFAIILGIYITLVTLMARRENEIEPRRRRWLAWALIPIALAGAVSVLPRSVHWIWAIAAGVLLVAWLVWAARRQSLRVAVPMWLAGICLLDAWFLTLIAQQAAAAAVLVLFVITVLAQRRIAAT